MYLLFYFVSQLVMTLCAHEGYFTVQHGYSVTTVYSSTTARTLLQCSNACRAQNDVTPGTCLAATYNDVTRQCSFSSQSATTVNPATKTVILSKVCGLPPMVNNGNLVVTSATPSGSTATVSCQGGLVATPTTVQCLPGSGWSNYGFDCVSPPGVNCIGACTNDVNGFRLCDGGGVGVCNTMQGRLEVYYNNVWGTVCDDYWLDGETWAIPNANVACRTFGYSSGVNKPMAFFGEGMGDIWLDDLNCVGTEQSLVDCPHMPWGSNNCMHAEDTGVVCSNALAVYCIGACTNDVNGFRLCDGGGVGVCNTMQGRLEVYYNNVWGTVCDDYWLDGETWAIPNANVACRTFGYSSGVNKPMAFFGEGVGDIWLDDLNCVGTEQSLVDCPHMPWGSNNCMHAEDTGVICSI